MKFQKLYLPLSSEGLAVAGLAASVLATKRRHVGGLEIVRLFGLRHETPLGRLHAKVVHPVGVPEETVLFWVLLHVSPPTALPAAGHQM